MTRFPARGVTADTVRARTGGLRDAGADAYLTKSLEIDAFTETLERFIPNLEGESQ